MLVDIFFKQNFISKQVYHIVKFFLGHSCIITNRIYIMTTCGHNMFNVYSIGREIKK